MRWNRQTVKAVVIAFLVVVVTSFFIRFTMEHDGASIVLFDDDPVSSAPVPAGDEVESGDTDPETGLPWVLETELPVEAMATLALIDQGGPYPYPDRDGARFQNREGLLPDRPGGYYAEYTVVTPGAGDRGPRRIVAGEGGEYFWTADHYASFARILRELS